MAAPPNRPPSSRRALGVRLVAAVLLGVLAGAGVLFVRVLAGGRAPGLDEVIARAPAAPFAEALRGLGCEGLVVVPPADVAAAIRTVDESQVGDGFPLYVCQPRTDRPALPRCGEVIAALRRELGPAASRPFGVAVRPVGGPATACIALASRQPREAVTDAGPGTDPPVGPGGDR